MGYRTSDMSYAEKRLVSWTFFFPPLIRNSDSRSLTSASRAVIASRARMHIKHSSSTPPPFFFLFHIHSSRGGLFSVGLLQENVSLLARTFLSRTSTRSWVSTLLSHGADPMGRRHMVREGGECPFCLISHHHNHQARSPILLLHANAEFDHDGPFILLCLWTCIILQVPRGSPDPHAGSSRHDVRCRVRGFC